MFDNIDKKIKGLAKLVFIAYAVLSVAPFFVFSALTIEFEAPFVLIAPFAAAVILFAGWVQAIFLYGFGQLIENTAPKQSVKAVAPPVSSQPAKQSESEKSNPATTKSDKN